MKNSAHTQITNSETQENNKLIAEFMGLDTITFNKEMYLLKWKNNLVQKKDDNIFKFHEDWNELMEVVKKCFEYGELHNEFREQIIASLAGVIDIEDTYSACIDFIKWYNANK